MIKITKIEEGDIMLEALKNAIKFEEDGYEFYKDIAAKMTQPLAKRLFESLAAQEKEHKKRILEIYDAEREGKEWKAENPALATMEDEVKALFRELDDEKKKIPLDHIEGYKLAMEMEKKGFNMYRKFSQEAKSPREKAFFETLMNEEKDHLSSLDNVYRFLTGSEEWYSEDESKVWNWMNT